MNQWLGNAHYKGESHPQKIEKRSFGAFCRPDPDFLSRTLGRMCNGNFGSHESRISHYKIRSSVDPLTQMADKQTSGNDALVKSFGASYHATNVNRIHSLDLSTSHWNLKMLPSCEALTPGLAHLKEIPFSAVDFAPATCQSWTATSANAQSWKLRNSSPPNQSIIFLCVILYPNSVQWWTNHWKLAETSNWF